MPTETLAMRAKVRQVPLTNYIIMTLSLSRVHLQEFKAGPIDVKTTCKSISPRGGYSLIWPIRGCAAGQGMVFGLSVLNRVCDFVRVCPKQGI